MIVLLSLFQRPVRKYRQGDQDDFDNDWLHDALTASGSNQADQTANKYKSVNDDRDFQPHGLALEQGQTDANGTSKEHGTDIAAQGMLAECGRPFQSNDRPDFRWIDPGHQAHNERKKSDERGGEFS